MTDSIPPINEILAGNQLRWQAWVFEHLGTTLAMVPHINSLPKRSVVADLVSACIQKVTRGDLREFVREFNSFNYVTVLTWRLSYALPELSRLMDLCYQTNVPMKDVLLGKISTGDLLPDRTPVRKGDSHYVTITELKNMEAALHSLLKENPPLSLVEVSKRLGCHALTVKRHFPELFRAIEKRRYTYEARRYDPRLLKSSLLAAIEQLPPPSLRYVATHLGCTPGCLRNKFPEESRIIVERYADFRKIFVDPEGVRAKFQALHNEFPPLSITQCAERLGCTRVQLYAYFPDICRVIGARYADYRKENARNRRESRRQAIIKTKIDLEAEQVSPTSYRIRKRLPHIKGLTLLEIAAALNSPQDNSTNSLSQRNRW